MKKKLADNISDHATKLKIRSRRNVFVAIIQVVVTGLSMFLLYRILLSTIGIESIGLWSLLMATTSLARISELGLSYSVVKFVAKYLALDDHITAAESIQTILLSVAIFFGVVSLVLYYPLLYILPNIVLNGSRVEAIALLPLALLSLWLSAICAVCQSGLDGCQRSDLRGYSTIAAGVLTLMIASWLVPSHGLYGLAYSQIGVSALLLTSNWAMLRYQLPALPIIPVIWSRTLFRESINYGAGVQVISLIAMFTDALTKGLLGKFGGLTMLGYHELASRMIGALRSVLVAPLQVMVPVIATFQETNREQVFIIYRKVVELQGYIAIPFYLAVGAMLPVISVIWIGHYESIFIIIALVQILGWFFNSFINPSYFINFGIGRLKWNVVSNIVIGLCNLILGLIFGNYFGGYGVIASWIISITLGSTIVGFYFHVDNKIPMSALLPKGSLLLTGFCLSGLITAWMIFKTLHTSITAGWLGIICFLSFAVVSIYPLWIHPMRISILEAMVGRTHRSLGS